MSVLEKNCRTLIQYKNVILPVYESHCGDKTVVRSCYLHNGISLTGKMASLYWTKPLVVLLRELMTFAKMLFSTTFQHGHYSVPHTSPLSRQSTFSHRHDFSLIITECQELSWRQLFGHSWYMFLTSRCHRDDKVGIMTPPGSVYTPNHHHPNAKPVPQSKLK